ncbi:MAG: HAMP domain-containing protein [Anaerolineae bacterium]|nr:HAMP domain-containing protein [Anaerolineae bacterium]
MNRNKFFLRASIRAKLTLSYLAVIVVAMGLSGFLLLSLLDRYFMEAMEQSLIAQAQIIAQALIPGAQTVEGNLASDPASNTLMQQQLRNYRVETENVAPPSGLFPLSSLDMSYLGSASLELSAQLETRIRVLDVNGVVLVDSAGELQGVSLKSDALVADALRGQYAQAVDRAGYVAQMHVAVPVTVEGQLVGAVYLSQTLRDVSTVLSDMRTRWLISVAVALVLSGAVGLILSGAIAQPLRRLTIAAGRVAEGQLDQQVPVRSRDELGRLSQAFNEMTARLKAARQMQTDFVANVSHELRTPLTSVKGLVETLQDGAVNDVQVRDRFLGTVAGETDRLIRLVNDLLLLSRVDSEALTLHKTEIDLLPLIRAAVDQLAPQAKAQGITVRIAAGPDIPFVQADPDRLTQVLLNLLDNALKYSPPGGVVTVQVSRNQVLASKLAGKNLVSPRLGEMIHIQVRDRGAGIPPDDLPHIGERFYRADKARSRAQGGSGLGIAIARALIELHGGTLRIDSVAGQGTTTTLTLPID